MKLREDWGKLTQFISIRAIALAGALQIAWPLLPQDMKDTLPPDLVSYLTWALLALTVYGIMVKQNLK
jgi:hypothetical protein